MKSDKQCLKIDKQQQIALLIIICITMCNLSKDNPFFQDLYLDISIFMNVCNIAIYIYFAISLVINDYIL